MRSKYEQIPSFFDLLVVHCIEVEAEGREDAELMAALKLEESGKSGEVLNVYVYQIVGDEN